MGLSSAKSLSLFFSMLLQCFSIQKATISSDYALSPIFETKSLQYILLYEPESPALSPTSEFDLSVTVY